MSPKIRHQNDVTKISNFKPPFSKMLVAALHETDLQRLLENTFNRKRISAYNPISKP